MAQKEGNSILVRVAKLLRFSIVVVLVPSNELWDYCTVPAILQISEVANFDGKFSSLFESRLLPLLMASYVLAVQQYCRERLRPANSAKIFSKTI